MQDSRRVPGAVFGLSNSEALSDLGYAGLLLLMVAETMFPPIPSEVVLPLAGYLVEQGDFAFVQHMVATLNAHGKMGVVMPHGVLFRGGSEGEIRKGLLQKDLIEVVVGLPTSLFYGTGITAAILMINRDKPKAIDPEVSGPSGSAIEKQSAEFSIPRSFWQVTVTTSFDDCSRLYWSRRSELEGQN